MPGALFPCVDLFVQHFSISEGWQQRINVDVVNHQFSIGKGLRAYGIVFVEMLYFDSAVPLMLLHGLRYMRCVRFAVYAVMSSFICLCFCMYAVSACYK